MTHPTPAAISAAISDRLWQDHLETKDDPHIQPMPTRINRLVREAISKACDDAQSARNT